MEENSKVYIPPTIDLEKWITSIDKPLYLHFKGKVVAKMGESTCSEDLHVNYLYREFEVGPEKISLSETLWSRPKTMFHEDVEPHKPRFKSITPKEAAELLYPEISKTILNHRL